MWIQQQATPAPLDELQGRTVGLKFECNHCHTEVFTDLLGVPAPDHLANSTEDDGQFEKEEIKCPGCDMTHEITVKSTFDGVTFEVSEVAPESVEYQIATDLLGFPGSIGFCGRLIKQERLAIQQAAPAFVCASGFSSILPTKPD